MDFFLFRETLEFEKQLAPHLHTRDFPKTRFPFIFVSSILTRYDLVNLCGVNDVLQPLVVFVLVLSVG